MVFPEYAVNTPYENVNLTLVAAMYSGMPAQPGTSINFWNYYDPNEGMMTQRQNLTEAVFQTPPGVTPNTGFIYSNWAYVVLGHLVEKNLGIPWEDAMMEYVVLPLGMSPDTSCPFTAADVENWGHIYFNSSVPLYPCNPNDPPAEYTEEEPYFACDNCPNIGPAGTYSGSIKYIQRYYQWVLGCANGDAYQLSKLPLTKQQCQLLQTGYKVYPPVPSYSFGYGWLVGSVNSIKVLTYTGSNTLNIANVNIYFDPIDAIVFSITNGGGEQISSELNMVYNTSSYLFDQAKAGNIICPSDYSFDSTQSSPTSQPSTVVYCPWAYGTSSTDDNLAQTALGNSNSNTTTYDVLTVIPALFFILMIGYIIQYSMHEKRQVEQIRCLLPLYCYNYHIHLYRFVVFNDISIDILFLLHGYECVALFHRTSSL